MERQKRISILKKLVEEYFTYNKGSMIEKPQELFRVVDIKEPVNERHPHRGFRVYISRKALKHFVESRKEELGKRHSVLEVSVSVFSAIEKIPEVFLSFDRYEYESNLEKYFYTKHYGDEPSLRILVQQKRRKSLEIRSMHFTRRRSEK